MRKCISPAWLRRYLNWNNTLIPHGLHIVGKPTSPHQRVDFLLAMSESSSGARPPRAALQALVDGTPPEAVLPMCTDSSEATLTALRDLQLADRMLCEDHEIGAIVHALDGGFLRPAPGGDVIRTPAVMPTGRNLHGFDPFRIPSAFAVLDGARQAARLLQRHMDDGNPLPESVALVLWGSDNLKTEGRSDRPGVGARWIETSLRCVRSNCWCDVNSVSGARTAADRRGRDVIRNFPRFAAAANQTARRSIVSCGIRR